MGEMKKDWKEVKGMKIRKGEREGWYEMLVEKENGEVVKMIGRKVREFWSERGKGEDW